MSDVLSALWGGLLAAALVFGLFATILTWGWLGLYALGDTDVEHGGYWERRRRRPMWKRWLAAAAYFGIFALGCAAAVWMAGHRAVL